MQETTNLIKLAQNGSPEAAGQLYHLHHPAIYRYLYYRTADQQVAEDLTGEVFLKMVQSLSGFTGELAAFRAWLFQVARNLSIDHLRRLQAHPQQYLNEEMEAPAPGPEHFTETSLDGAALRAALTGLADDQKDVIILRFFEGLPLAETARILHKSEDAVKGLQRRALFTLRQSLVAME